MIGIIGALSAEVELLKKQLQDITVKTFLGREYFSGRLGETEVCVCESGIGKVNAAGAASVLILHYGAKAVINTGVAGGIAPGCKVYDMVISDKVCYHDFTKGILMTSFPFCEEFSADETLVSAAVESFEALQFGDVHCFVGTVTTGDQFIADSAIVADIKSRTNGFCVEMEGAAIGQVCLSSGIPFLVIRSISDKADEHAEVSFETFVASAAERSAALLCHMITSDRLINYR